MILLNLNEEQQSELSWSSTVAEASRGSKKLKISCSSGILFMLREHYSLVRMYWEWGWEKKTKVAAWENVSGMEKGILGF